MPDSPGPSWKHSAGQAARPATSRKTWQPGRPQAARGPVDPRRKYRRRLAMAAVSGAILIGLLIAVILWWKPVRGPSLVFIGPMAPDSTVVPQNAAAGPTAEGLRAFASDNRHGPRKSEIITDPAPNAAKWHEAIDNSSGPLVLYFTCPGAADKTGPFLWLVPADAPVADASHHVSITQVLNRLKELPEARQKLLILDAATEPVSWARGYLHNDFARRLKEHEAEIKAVPNLVVICSADSDQRSWVAEEWRQTAFGHFLLEKLNGAGGEPNDRVTAADLFKFVQTSVTQWAQANRDVEQKPILLPSDDGEARAAKIVITTLGPNPRPATPPAEAPGRSFSVPDGLKNMWTRSEELAQASPAPETKAPHLWQQYLDLLLRAEQVVRITGEVPAPLSQRLTQLERDLAAPPWKAEPSCIPFSLPAGPALGYPRPTIQGDDFRAVWTEEDARRNDTWSALADRLDRDRLRAGVRLAAADALLRYFAADQKPDKAALDRAAELLKHVDVGQPRPVETHLLRIMQKQISTPRDPDLIRLTLAVQVEAERTAWFVGPDNAHPYAEQVSRWFGKRLESLDKQRRDSTDLVFAGDTKSGADARSGLEQVRKSYGELGRDAATLGAAFRLRDRVLARLPYYARWAAGRRISADEAGPALNRVKLTAEKAHELAHALESPDPAGLARIQNLVQDLDGTDDRPGQFRALETEFKTHLTTLRSEAVPSNWHAIDNALAVPFIPTPTRVELLGKLRSISRRLNDASDPGERVKSAPVDPREMAQRQGQMALAILGERQGTELPMQSRLAWKEIRQRVDAPDLGRWWDSIGEAGEWIGAAFAALPRESARLADHGARGNSSDSETELTKAARYARLVDGATVLIGSNPAAVEQRFWTHILLIALAERAAADGWADLDETATQTYSLLAASRYLDSAESILLDGQTSIEPSERERRLATVKAARGRLKELAFDINARDPLTLTDQSSETLGYQVTPRGGATGYPVLRLRTVSPPLESKEYPVNEYRAVSGFSVLKDGPLAGTLNLVVSGAASGSKGDVVLDLLYRGRVHTKKVQALYEGTPTYRWIYNPPTGQKASFAIKGDEALRNGAVAFLIDVSGSMKNLNKETGRPRYKEAAEGLRQVLSQLPDDTIVSVSFFAGNDDKGKPIPGIETTKLKNITWQRAKADEVVDDYVLKRARNGDQTGIAEAIKAALANKDIFPGKQFTGFRNIVVITDGADNVSDDPDHPTAKPGQLVVDALNNADVPDIGLHLVLFGISNDEYKAARTQFDAIEETRHYESRGRTPAQIWPKIADGKENRLERSVHLSEVLKEAMLPRATIRRKDTMVGHLPVSIAADKRWAWLLPLQDPGRYQLWALESRQTLQLDPADRLLLELKRGKDGIEIALPSYVHARPDLPVHTRATSADGIVHLTVPRNSLTLRAVDYDLDLTATLEKPVFGRQHLHQERPMFAWFEVTPQAADRKPTSLRVENLLRRYAPAWALTSANWPPEKGQSSVSIAPALPRVEAYWLDTEPRATATREFTSLNVADRELKEKDRKFSVDDGQVEIEEFTVRGNYLTIRLNHTEGKPVVVRAYVQGLSQTWTLGEDHKFFGNANRYTATFGPIEPDDLPKRLTLKFLSIASVKAMATPVTVDVREAPSRNARNYLPEAETTKD